MEAIGTLAGGIAHDFNNILSSILGFSDLALTQAQKGSVIEDDLKEIHAAGHRAKELVKQILTFARKSEDTIKPVRVDIIAKEVLKLIRSSIPSTIIIVEEIENTKQVLENPTQIHQILMNLITNAAHSMDESGGVLECSLKDLNVESAILLDGELLKPGNYLKLIVSDTGTGIPDDIIESIFEPYFTTKDQGEGTGMGLAVVHGIIEKCNGKIFVESEYGKGSIFTIFLPSVEDEVKENTKTQLESPKGDESILFVDDEPAITKMGKRVLSELGYNVDVCTSSIDALELFKKKTVAYDLIISDMTMPKMTGYQLAEQILKIQPGTKFILCTGYSNKVNQDKIRKIGISALMIKPVDNEQMANMVRKILDG